jgi:hypothetical protein
MQEFEENLTRECNRARSSRDTNALDEMYVRGRCEGIV